MSAVEMKVCKTCMIAKCVSEFRLNGGGRRRAHCKLCSRAKDLEYHRNWVERNREHCRAYGVEYHREWREMNREHYREYQRAYHREWYARRQMEKQS